MPTPQLWQSLLDGILSTDPQRRIRTSMALQGLLLLVASAAVLLYAMHAGMAPMHYVRWWALISVAGMALLVGLVRTGWTERLRDPSLTIGLMGWTIACSAWAYAIAGPARGIVPATLGITLFFGAFSLRPTLILGLGLYTLVLFAIALALAPHLDTAPHNVLDTAYAAITLVVLLTSMALSLRVQRIRGRMRQQRTELSRALALNRELATRDELTGLLNRRHMLELMQLEQRRAERSGRNLVVALLDIDHFKLINDNHGHATGDHALQLFATAVRGSVRGTDVLARWGGEEFVLLISDTSTDDAADLLERVRCAVAALALPHAGGVICFTVSIGMAVYQAGDSIEYTLERADKALYAAKNSGRDRVVQAVHMPPPQAQTV